MSGLAYGDVPEHFAQARGEDTIALIYPDRAMSWGELESRSTRRAKLFQAHGVGQDDFVTIAIGNSSLFYENVFAVWKLGATPNIVSSRLPAHEFKAIVGLAHPKLIVGESADAEMDVTTLLPNADISGIDDTTFPAKVAKYWKAMTSGGSTGGPKLIVDHGPARCPEQFENYLIETMRMPHDSVILNPGPLYHNAPFGSTMLALFFGCMVVGMQRFDAEEALALIEKHRANWICLVPTMMHRIWSLPSEVRQRYDLSSLNAVWHMAAPCPTWLKRAWIDWFGADRIWELYGGTEGIGTTRISGTEWLRKPGSVGRAVDSEIKASRGDGTLCAPGEVGELHFRFPLPDMRPSHYVGAEAKVDAEGWQSLGDMGSIDEEGFVFLADRRTDLILRGGANIYPAEIEAVLDSHSAVASSIVVPLPHDQLGQSVHAIVEEKADHALEVHELHAFMRARVAAYKLPESYELANGPLRDDAGKARRSALRDERAAWLAAGQSFQIMPSRQTNESKR